MKARQNAFLKKTKKGTVRKVQRADRATCMAPHGIAWLLVLHGPAWLCLALHDLACACMALCARINLLVCA
eukprot:365686-Chlamydomonas_euryale.AAC.1